MDRRTFLISSAGAAAGLSLACGTRAESSQTDASDASSEGAGNRLARVGVQLYTLRALMQEDVERTLAQVAEVGYREVEFAGYFGRSAADLRATLDAEGLTAPATHHGIDVFRTRLDEELEYAATVGHRYLVLPSLPGDEVETIDGYRRIAEEMNGFGERCRAAGIGFGFHNHDREMQAVDGEVPLDVMIEGTDPALVTYEIDLFWAVHGGGDPLDYFDRYPGRFALCHVKDRTADGQMVDVGQGAIDFAAIFARSDEAGLQHYFVEHDRPGDDPIASVRRSYQHLSSLDI